MFILSFMKNCIQHEKQTKPAPQAASGYLYRKANTILKLLLGVPFTSSKPTELLPKCCLLFTVKSTEQVLPGREGGGGAGGRNDPNNVCTCEYMNNNNKKRKPKSKSSVSLSLQINNQLHIVLTISLQKCKENALYLCCCDTFFALGIKFFMRNVFYHAKQ
jgi:hypothetical protein